MVEFQGNDIILTRGDTLAFTVQFEKELPEGTTARFAVKRKLTDVDCIFVQDVNVSEDGRALFAMDSLRTWHLKPMDYAYDVRVYIIHEGEEDEIRTPMEPGAIHVLPAVGKLKYDIDPDEDYSGEEHVLQYSRLAGLPSINGVELVGDVSSEELGIEPEHYDDSEIREELGELKKDLTQVSDYVDSASAFDGATSELMSLGSINVLTGVDYDANTQFRTKTFLEKSVDKIILGDDYRMRVFVYDGERYVGVWKDGQIVQTTVWLDEKVLILSDLQQDYNIRVTVGKISGTITADDLKDIHIKYSVAKKLPSEIVKKESIAPNMQELLTAGVYEGQEITWGSENRYVNINTGAISDAGTIKAHVSDYIPCDEWEYIRYTGSPSYSFPCLAFFRFDKSFIRAYPNASSNTNYWMEEIKVPDDAKYVVFENNSGISGKLAVKVEFMKKFSVNSARTLTGKKWVCVGDSHTEINNRATMRYMDYVQIETGIKTINMGVSGTGYANHHAEGKAFIDRITSVPTDADVVTIYGSFNDVFSSNPIPLGTVSDTGTSTLCGFINGTIDTLYEHFPSCVLGIVTPCPWQNANPKNTESDASKYVNALIEICKLRGIPCLDLYHCSGLRPWEASYREVYYSRDEGNGVHPNELGHKLIAPRFKSFIESLVM